MQVWDEALKDGCQPDCRMATTLIEVCTRKGDTDRALETYQLMQQAAPGSNMAPSIHAYTAAMRAAAEGGAWQQALDIWADMEQAKCKPTGESTCTCCKALVQIFCSIFCSYCAAWCSISNVQHGKLDLTYHTICCCQLH